MKILAFSDLRVQDLNLICDYLTKSKNNFDLIVYSGDDLDRLAPIDPKKIEQFIINNPKKLIYLEDIVVLSIEQKNLDLNNVQDIKEFYFKKSEEMLEVYENFEPILIDKEFANRWKKEGYSEIWLELEQKIKEAFSPFFSEEVWLTTANITKFFNSEEIASSQFIIESDFCSFYFNIIEKLDKIPFHSTFIIKNRDYYLKLVDMSFSRQFLKTRPLSIDTTNLKKSRRTIPRYKFLSRKGNSEDLAFHQFQIGNKQYLIIYIEKENYLDFFSKETTFGLVFVPGNDDFVQYYLREFGNKVHDLHNKPLALENISFIGVGGNEKRESSIPENNLPTAYTSEIITKKDTQALIFEPTYLEFNEQEIFSHLQNQLSMVSNSTNVFLISHSPPIGALDLSIRYGIGHVGSKAIRDFISVNHKLISLNICGHSHLWGGSLVHLNSTKILNIASHDSPETSPIKFSKIILDQNNNISIKIFELKAEEEDNIPVDRLSGIGIKRGKILKKIGVNYVNDLAKIDLEELLIKIDNFVKTERNKGRKVIRFSRAVGKAKIAAMAKKKLIYNSKIQELTLNPMEGVYLDLETGSYKFQNNFIWLIGLYFPKIDEVKQLTITKDNSEKMIIKKFLKILENLSDEQQLYTYSASFYDKSLLLKRINHYKLQENQEALQKIQNIKNIYHFIKPITFFPEYGLKYLANFLGYNFSKTPLAIDGNKCGLIGVHLFSQGVMHSCDYCLTKEIVKQAKIYNTDNLKSLFHLAKSLSEMPVNKMIKEQLSIAKKWSGSKLNTK